VKPTPLWLPAVIWSAALVAVLSGVAVLFGAPVWPTLALSPFLVSLFTAAVVSVVSLSPAHDPR
jgi:hypothetical protein